MFLQSSPELSYRRICYRLSVSFVLCVVRFLCFVCRGCVLTGFRSVVISVVAICSVSLFLCLFLLPIVCVVLVIPCFSGCYSKGFGV